MKPPWWFCCGWWSPWCVLDTVAHWLRLHRALRAICDKHDAIITREERAEFLAAWERGTPVDLIVSPNLRVISAPGFRVRKAPQTWGSGSTLIFDHTPT